MFSAPAVSNPKPQSIGEPVMNVDPTKIAAGFGDVAKAIPKHRLAILESKCRRCAGISEAAPTDSALVYDWLVSATSGKQSPQLPTMLSIHQCPGGGWGVTDLIGAKWLPEY